MTFRSFFNRYIEDQYDSQQTKECKAHVTSGRRKFPASILAKKLGVEEAAIRNLLSPCELRHITRSYDIEYYCENEASEKLVELLAWEG
jgi:hypothetical protein